MVFRSRKDDKDVIGQAWEAFYSRLLAFRNEHGHLRLPIHCPGFNELDQWIREQRNCHTRLEPEQVLRLFDLGIDFGKWQTHWYHGFFELRDYVEQSGEFPKNRTRLARWLESQRRYHNRGEMIPQRTRWLNSLGVVWKVDGFAKHLAELKAFKAKHGHCNVPYGHLENPALGHYVCMTLRGTKRKLSAMEIKQLEAIGFVWDIREEAWQSSFRELVQFIAAHSSYPSKRTHPRLAKWMQTQRRLIQTPERIRQLDEMGFAWNPLEERWLVRFMELKAFRKKFGHCRVPAEDEEHHQLWKWLYFQKTQKKMMSAKRRKLLDALGVDWSIEKRISPNNRMRQLEAFYRKHGHCNATLLNDKRLAFWLGCLRRRRHRLSAETITKLEAMNIDWSPATTLWNRRYEESVEFWKRFGHCRIPAEWPENRALPTWVYTQRRRWNRLRQERRQRLSALGIGPVHDGHLCNSRQCV